MEISGINPNCSEAVFRLGGTKFSVDTSLSASSHQHPNGLVEDLIQNSQELELDISQRESDIFVNLLKDQEMETYEVIEELEDEGKYQVLGNIGGGADFRYVEKVICLFILYKEGLINEEGFKELDHEAWSGSC